MSLSSAKSITVDLDVFIGSESGFPYMIPNPLTKSRHRTAISLQQSSGAHVAGTQAGDGTWQIWDSDRYKDSGIRIAYDVWNHLQMALDVKSGTYKLVLQPVGELPGPAARGRLGNVPDKASPLSFIIAPSKSGSQTSLYDNLLVAFE
jgi:hypothetical protein